MKKKTTKAQLMKKMKSNEKIILQLSRMIQLAFSNEIIIDLDTNHTDYRIDKITQIAIDMVNKNDLINYL